MNPSNGGSMKKLVVFYSLEGNTRLVAKTIAEASGADLLELKPALAPPSRGFKKYFWGGRAALMHAKPGLAPFEVDPSSYDMLFIGTPVWAWTFAPPMNTFLSGQDLSGKKIALFCCHGGGPGRIFQKMRAAMPGGVFLGEMDFQEPLAHETEAEMKKAREWALSILGSPGL